MTERPEVSLIVPLQDEEDTVEALVQSVASQLRPPDELILVDAGSKDQTVARALAACSGLAMTVLRAPRVNPGIARNLGAAKARCTWLAFTDGGIRLHGGWLAHLQAEMAPGVDVVLGSFDPICDSYFRRCAAVAYVPPRTSRGMRGPSTASLAVSRGALDAVGGFPPYRAAEDLAFFEKVRERLVAREAPEAVARWEIARTLAGTFRRFSAYSYHNLAAGRGSHWHLGVGRLYVALSAACVACLLLGVAPLALALVPVFFVGRALKAAWVKRNSFDFPTLRMVHVLGAAGVLATIDAATALGTLKWIQALLTRRQPYAGRDERESFPVPKSPRDPNQSRG